MQTDHGRVVGRELRIESPDRLATLSVHLVGEEGLLLDSARQRLYALNGCAAFIWSSLKDGKLPAEIGRRLKERFAVPADAAASYVAEVLRQYAALCSERDVSSQEIGRPATRRPANSRRRQRGPEDAGAVETYSLLGSAFRVHYESTRLRQTIHPLLQYLTPPAGAPAMQATDVVVASQDDGIAVLAGEDEIGSSWTQEDAAVAVRACLTQLAVSRTGGLCVVHAGALRRNGGALLLPGEAGRGKSTLSAGLAARGFDMLCDDTTLLAGEPPLVQSIATGLCIKRGAYGVLEPLYPRLRSLAEWRRPDGRHARYLMPGDGLRWAEPGAVVGVRWMVFPHYRPDHGTALLPLPRHRAVGRLLRGVCFLSGSLDTQNLDRLIAWIEGIDCFELPLSSLDAATALLEELCR